MLSRLSIRDIVVIEKLDISFNQGLCVLSGETGAGKSILLDALGLALGDRADTGLIRLEAPQASVTAEFTPVPAHPVFETLKESGIAAEDTLILRRTLAADGKSKAFINDEPISISLLRKIGESLIEIHGQFDQLLDPKNHLNSLDDFAGLELKQQEVKKAYDSWQSDLKAYTELQNSLEHSSQEKELLLHHLEELEQVSPSEEEEETLQEERTTLVHQEKLKEAISTSLHSFQSPLSVEETIVRAIRTLEKVVEYAPAKLTPIVESLERSSIEIQESLSLLEIALETLNEDESRLDVIEERLSLLRDLARKHHCLIRDLPEIKSKLEVKASALQNSDGALEEAKQALLKSLEAYKKSALELHEKRKESKNLLEERVHKELPFLKLEKARFEVKLVELPEEKWSAKGIDQVEFLITTNPGSLPGPLLKVASGGERSRLMLALKTILADRYRISAMIFDEADTGIGGATADAVGKRLFDLSKYVQVLVVTHSPQVAAKADHHWKVEKWQEDNTTTTKIYKLEGPKKQEEIARMLSGAEVTSEARAAAGSLLQRSESEKQKTLKQAS